MRVENYFTETYFYIFLYFVFILSFSCTYLYRKIAIKAGILADPNFRSLHELPVPRGGGIVFSSVFIIAIFGLWFFKSLSLPFLITLSVGGGAAAIFGFLDDIYNIRASTKLLIQIFLGVWGVYCLYDYIPSENIGWLGMFIFPVIVFFIVGIINAFNFMDVIDGMAVSGA